MAGQSNDSRRELRRKRRIRTQMTVYAVLLIIIAAVVVGGFYGVKFLIKFFNTDAPMLDVASVSDNISETVSDNEPAPAIISPEEPQEPEEPEPIIEPVPENEQARAYIDSMSLEEKVASLFVITPESLTGVNCATMAGDGTKSAIAEYEIGGLIYDTQNIQTSEQFTELISNTKAMYEENYNAPLWTFVEEGGLEYTFTGAGLGYTEQATPGDMAAAGDDGASYQAYLTIGSYLNQYGIDVNISPVCDVETLENSYLGNMSFGADAEVCSSMVARAVDGMAETGVISCLRTFPGEGELTAGTNVASGSTQRTLEEMQNCEFLPFTAGIDAGAQFVMVSHIAAPAVTGDDVPSSLSNIMVTDVLRNQLGYNGIIITDRMDNAAISNNYSSGDAAVMALQAGVDMILCPVDYKAAYQAVLDAVNNGTISEERIDESLMRIYSLKFPQ